MCTPLVSVVIPSFCHEKYVADTIRSVIEQTYQNIELIIIDDGSSDHTWDKILDLLPECKKRFVNVVAKTKRHAGICDSLNMASELLNGEYVTIIASDDVAKPYMISSLLSFLVKNPDFGLAVGNNEIIDKHGKKCGWDLACNCAYTKSELVYPTFVDWLKKNNPRINPTNFGTYATFCVGNYIPNGYLIRRSIFDHALPFPNQIQLEDWYLHLQLSKYCRYKYVDQILLSYRWHDTNTIKKIRSHSKQTIHEVLVQELRIVKNKPGFNKTFGENARLHKTYFQLTKYFRLYKTPCRLILQIGAKKLTLSVCHNGLYEIS